MTRCSGIVENPRGVYHPEQSMTNIQIRPEATFRRDGIFAALWIPTDKEGRLLKTEMQGHVALLKERGVHGILALGSTGEFLQFSPDQRKVILSAIAECASPLPVIANISDLRPAVVHDLARFARTLGVAGVALLPPHFYPVAQPDLAEFFVRGAEAAALPLLLYNFPERTGNRLSLETVAAVAAHVPVAAIKQSGDEFSYHLPLVELGREKGFAVFTGADTRLADAMALGVAGCIGGLVNAVPELMVEIFDAVQAGFPERAIAASQKMRALGELLSPVMFPLNIAATMEARGWAVGHPKSIVSRSTQEAYDKLVQELRKLYREWKLI